MGRQSDCDSTGRLARMKYGSSVAMRVAASISLVALLNGCTFGEDLEHYAIFDREAQRADAPPSELADEELYDMDSLRFATEFDGDRLYLARGSDPNGGICLLIDGPGDDGVSGACSGGGSWVGMNVRHEYHVHPDSGVPLPDEGYTDLTENISVKTG